jgi:hypothetical protein
MTLMSANEGGENVGGGNCERRRRKGEKQTTAAIMGFGILMPHLLGVSAGVVGLRLQKWPVTHDPHGEGRGA